MNPNTRQEIAQWRMSILGALVSARLGHGDRQALLQAAASRVYETPDGRRVRYEWRTLESWYYRYKAGGLSALQPRQRKDAGICRAIAAETILTNKYNGERFAGKVGMKFTFDKIGR